MPSQAVALLRRKKTSLGLTLVIVIAVVIVVGLELSAKRYDYQPIKSHLRPRTRVLRHRRPSCEVPAHFRGPAWNRDLWNIANSDPDASTTPRLIDDPFLLVAIASAPSNFDRRSAIRKSLPGSSRVQVVFLIGESRSPELTRETIIEATDKRDVVIGPYADTYRNLTLKTVHGLLWSHRTVRPNYVLKTDDDCFVNLCVLLELLQKRGDSPRPLYVGNMRWESKVIRDPSSRWFVPEHVLHATQYPPYGSGAGYLLNNVALDLFVGDVHCVGPFPNEDAYIGVVMNIASVTPVQSARFATRSPGLWICNFLYVVVVHGVSALEQGKFAEKVAVANQRCRGKFIDTEWN
ncbi:beta-1,3-galactosyltransferase 1-like [Ornithodoros turicata]|uniref:beta-1,3-galactosyltransferase 1-like n=1 Tax=Ornithodoros turicata TaxID=34597 RepID=UPI003138B67E